MDPWIAVEARSILIAMELIVGLAGGVLATTLIASLPTVAAKVIRANRSDSHQLGGLHGHPHSPADRHRGHHAVAGGPARRLGASWTRHVRPRHPPRLLGSRHLGSPLALYLLSSHARQDLHPLYML